MIFHSVFMGLCWAITVCFPVFAVKPLVIFPAIGTRIDYKESWREEPPFVAKNPKLIPFEDGVWNKNGYKDQSGKIVLPSIYRWAAPFNDFGIAPVAVDKPIKSENHAPYVKGQIDDVVPGNPLGCFYINEKGEKIADAYEIDNGWDYPTRKGFVRITKNGKIGIMHISGKILVSPQYTTLCSVYDSSLLFTGHGQKVHRGGHGCSCGDATFGGTYGLINDDGEEVAPVKFSKIANFYLDSDDKIIMNLKKHTDPSKYKSLLVLYQGKKAYVLYRDAKNKLGIRRESAYDEGSGLKPALVKASLWARDVHTPK